MGHKVTVGAGRRASVLLPPLSAVERRQGARQALTASGLIPTYDLLYGNHAGRLFNEKVMEAELPEMTSAMWPHDGFALDDEHAVFRDGDDVLYLLPGGVYVLATLAWGWLRVRAAAGERDAVVAAVEAFREKYPATFMATDDDRVPVTFWALGPNGPVAHMRRIDAQPWAAIAGNYTASVREQLAGLMSGFEPAKGGQLLLWQGEPGTGKTWALRALASEWAPWAEFHYITDPDSFFVDSPSYMIDVLLSDSYEAIDEAGDVYSEAGEGKWRVLILEDTGELLSANAKEKYGQGLSRLLNVVDGMIGQGLKVLCLVTTNDELGDLNEAVRRPGRCASQIEFVPMTPEETAAWLGAQEAMEGATLAELYAKKSGEPDTDPDPEPEPDGGFAGDLVALAAEPLPELDPADPLDGWLSP